MIASEDVPRWLLSGLNTTVPKIRGKIVVHSLPDLEDGALALIDELCARGHKPILLCEQKSTRADSGGMLPGSVRAVAKNSPSGRYHFLTAETVFTTHSVYRIHRPPRSQTVVNVWHAEPLTKAVGRWDGAPPTPSTWATALSPVGQAFRCVGFDLEPSQVLVVGAPRNDRLLRADRPAIRHIASGGQGGRRLFLWLPTYRNHWSGRRIDGVSYDGMVPMDAGSLEALDHRLLEHDALLLVKPHPLSRAAPLGRYQRIRAIDAAWLLDRQITLYMLMGAVDCLITDVSSVWIDFLLVDRPLIFAFPDIDAYRQTRDIHLEPYEAWAPGPLVATGQQLSQEIDRVVAGEDAHARERRDLTVKLHRYTDDRSTARLLDAIGM